MRVAFTADAPKDLYVFRNIGNELNKRGHVTKFFVRDWLVNNQVAKKLLGEYVTFGTVRGGPLGKIIEMIYNDLSAWKPIHDFQPDVVVGDALLGHVARALRVPSIAFVDGDPEGIWWLIYNTIYVSDVFVMPEWNLPAFKGVAIRYRGLAELAYLRPPYFRPDASHLDEIGLKVGEPFALLRLSALEMSHDFGLRGMSMKLVENLVKRIEPHARVFISSERELSPSLRKHRIRVDPSRIHDVINLSTLLVAETAMAVEGGVLGVPTVQVSPVDSSGRPFFARISNFRKCMSSRLFPIVPADNSALIEDEILKILEDPVAAREQCSQAANRFASQCIDLVKFGADVIEQVASQRRGVHSSNAILA